MIQITMPTADTEFNLLIAKFFNRNFTVLTLCLADAIHNLMWVKIIQTW